MSIESKTSGKAIASLICAVVGVLSCGILSIPALVLGIWALCDIHKHAPALTGKGIAIAGTVLSGIWVLLIPFAVALILPAVQSARKAADRARDMNHIKIVGLSVRNSQMENGVFPEGTSSQGKDRPVAQRLSWIASILPYLDEGDLHDRLVFDEAWNSIHNQPITDEELRVLHNPSIPADQAGNRTHYVGMSGVGEDAAELPNDDPNTGIFGYDRQTDMNGISDGPGNTILLINVDQNLGPWGQGGSSTIRGFSAEPYFGGPDGFGRGTPGGFHVLMADGSVRFIPDDIDPKVLEAMATKAGGELTNDE